jgi:hypothetical protein
MDAQALAEYRYRALGLEPPDPPAGPTGKGVCTAATVSAGCSASTTDKLHEQVSAPYASAAYGGG